MHIVDDASNDDTVIFVKGLIDYRKDIYYCKHEKRMGISSARNTRLYHARGTYIAFLDDDAWDRRSLEYKGENSIISHSRK
jgi:glycosyltransferase involved in cell wall biosynthesis